MAAESRCMKCGGPDFELVTRRVEESTFPLAFIQCASCGSVVGVMETRNVAAMLDNLNRVVRQLGERFGVDTRPLA